jgi:probable rRNA maturation factor
MIDIVNLQRRVKIDAAVYRVFVASLSDTVAEAADRTFSVAFISDRRMKQLNETFRGRNTTTDVLSFRHEPDDFISGSRPYEKGVAPASGNGVVPSSDSSNETRPKGAAHIFLGDIVISAEQAQKQSIENNLDLETEIKQLILHGLLHLCGYDHTIDTGQMDARELELRARLGI